MARPKLRQVFIFLGFVNNYANDIVTGNPAWRDTIPTVHQLLTFAKIEIKEKFSDIFFAFLIMMTETLYHTNALRNDLPEKAHNTSIQQEDSGLDSEKDKLNMFIA